MNPVLVFKTSVTSKAEAAQLSPLLNTLLQKESRWNFDLEDWQNILRVESKTCAANDIINMLNKAGYQCEELPD